MIGTLRTMVVAALLLAAGNAWALGLGQIEVKSKRNQPLLAEIPIVSTTPGELAALQARLASPETFRRVGLAPPSGIASDLQFTLGSDAKGRPVIRVTTVKPVDQATLNFLIEVDWGKGRLVREYSVLVDAPNTAGAIVQPTIQVPQPAPAQNLVQRPEPPAAEAPAPSAQPEASAQRDVAMEAPPAETPDRPAAVDVAPLPPSAPAPASVPAAAPLSPPADAASQYGPVKRGETLSKIASGLGLRKAFSLDQTMLALLRANPDAFLSDDVNRLRSGAVLRVPEQGEVARIGEDEAAQVVRQQMQQWRQSRRTLRQPDVAAASAPAAQAPEAGTRALRPGAASMATAASAATMGAAAATVSPIAPPRREKARLQIVPPSVPGKATGTRSGTSAGGEGSMLQQELRQRDEDIAAKTAEIGELKERVAALEKLKNEQQQLLSLKDSELAAAQARLAEANKAAPQAQAAAPAPADAKAATQAAPAPDSATQSHATPYIWGGIGVMALALLAWLLTGKRRQAAPAPRRSMFDSEALAASMPAPRSEPVAEEPPVQVDEAPAVPVEAIPEPAAATPTIDLASVPPTPPRMETPTWHSGWVKAEPAPPPAAEPASAPLVDDLPDLDLPAPPATVSVEQQFKLVDAFVDMGDKHSARELLIELMNGDDDDAAAKAGKMLSRLMG